MLSLNSNADDSLDLSKRYVRFHRLTKDNFVEFEFGIGTSEYMVELIMPKSAYHEFCTAHSVIRLTDATGPDQDEERTRWLNG